MIGLTELGLLVAVAVLVFAALGRRGNPDALTRTLIVGGIAIGTLLLVTRNLGIATVVLPFIVIALPVAGAVDAALIPDGTWRAADQNKLVWVGLQAGLAIVLGAGFITSLVYFISVRPKLKRARPSLGGGPRNGH